MRKKRKMITIFGITAIGLLITMILIPAVSAGNGGTVITKNREIKWTCINGMFIIQVSRLDENGELFITYPPSIVRW